MKNFFEHQDQAKRTTSYLVFLFGCAIASTILAMYLACMLMAVHQGMAQSLWQLEWLIAIAGCVCLTIAFGSARKMAALRGGGSVVAQSLGGQLVSQDTADGQERELLNVVEEMAIASGVAVPDVYLLPEASINAFAAGLTPNSAVIGVTQGCVSALNRDELQGVIGHEFSHIVNGDMAINLKLMGLIHGLLLIHLIGRELLFGRTRYVSGSRGKNNGAVIGFACSAMVIGGLSWIFGQLIKSAVSRQREFLADASAVQFTRNPNGITDALRRIAQQSSGSQMSSSEAESASHLFFNNISPLGAFANAFSTHPPLAERIRRLGGGSTNLETSAAQSRASNIQPSARRQSTVGQLGAPGFAASVSSFANAEFASNSVSLERPDVAPAEVVSTIGTVTPDHLDQAHSILSHLPAGLLESARSQPGAVAVVYGLLIDTDAGVRSRQKQTIANSSQTVHDLLCSIEPLFAQVPVQSRLPLLELCIPTLKTLKPKVAAQVFNCVKALVQADGKLSLSEYALQTVLQYRLAPHFRAESSPASATQLTDIGPDSFVILSVLAKAGHSDPSHADYAFRNGISQLPKAAKQSIPSTLPAYSLHDVSRSLTRLRTTAPKTKQAIAEACAHTVLTDSHTTDKEAELLRAILISLGCPTPPFLNAVPDQVAIAA